MKNEKSLAHNAIFSIIYRVLNVLFPLISATYVSRILLPAGTGRVSYAMNIASYFTVLAALCIPTYGTREIAKVRNDPEATNRVFSELLVINAVSTLIAGVGYLAVLFHFFRNDLSLYLICGSQILFNFANIDWYYQGIEDYAYIIVRSTIAKLVYLVFLFLFVKSPRDGNTYALLLCLTVGVNNIYNIFHTRKYVKLTLRGLSFRRHCKPIAYLAAGLLSAELYCKIDITMLGSLCTDDIVGYYTYAQKTVVDTLAITTAITTVFLPRISYYYSFDKAKYNETLETGTKIVAFFAIPAFAGLFLVADNLAPVLFGAAFLPAVGTIRILSLLIIVKSFGDILCYQVIISSGQERKLLPSYVMAALVNVLLNGLLIPSIYHDGAAAASVASELLLNITLFLFVSRKILDFHIPGRFFLGIMLGTACMSVCVMLIGLLVSNCFAALALQLVIGAAVYFSVCLLIKNELTITVLHTIRSRLHRKQP